MESSNEKNAINISGDMDGNIIVGNNNQIHVSTSGAEKTASELAMQRLNKEYKMLRNSFKDFLTGEIVQKKEKDPSILTIAVDIFTGRTIDNYNGARFYATAAAIEGFSINGEKVKKTKNEQEMIQAILNMSSQEVQQIIDCLPLAWKDKQLLEGTRKFGEIVLDYVIKEEHIIIEYRKHKAVVNA